MLRHSETTELRRGLAPRNLTDILGGDFETAPHLFRIADAAFTRVLKAKLLGIA
jgi:hypothetical protein